MVVTGYAGQVSLAQLALAGAGGVHAQLASPRAGACPFPIAPLLAALVAAVVGVVIGLPALRLRGLTLGVVTLAFAYAIEAVWFRNTDIVGTSRRPGRRARRCSASTSASAPGHAFPRVEFGLVCLVVLVVVASASPPCAAARSGSAMLAVRANERSAAGVGVNVVRVKVAQLRPRLVHRRPRRQPARPTAAAWSRSTRSPRSAGLALLSTAYLAGVTSVWGGVLAGILASTGIVFVALDKWVDLGEWFAGHQRRPAHHHPDLPPRGPGVGRPPHRRPARRMAAGSPGRQGAEAREAAGGADGSLAVGPAPGARRARGPVPRPAAPPPPARPSTVEHLTVRYGGVVAVDDVSLRVEPRQIVGLIGPNGAGKTSVIDAITGFAPATGAIDARRHRRLDGMPPHARVRAGLARTFQSLELYDDLSRRGERQRRRLRHPPRRARRTR